ncbi:AbfB domain-containing protein [Actinacidiphila oryziradicis]|uniref:Alpha-L-arabinofuranosidase B arabinose-binding domain-containing protein n=1 Tax=Actinacidiphila oryziradicis TaxID=2571141 RepID=A0A4U0SN84_9ACTN|nr:AbfB domain-containing protein [Actinacidiphila oryziradicis]TKA11434.1 hypothetical protein FCI23_11435 [Actinacidiphila oryziradicis]
MTGGRPSACAPAVTNPGRYLRHRNFQLWLDQYQNSQRFHADSSFTIGAPLA